ncbi:MAG TPA: M6 family metalloprotease domain-containing protein, partial [Nocardioidaceae bacterium]|nr:M6 family metalloprotease domain-containing protein [Nocardioidaceae bacterium]
MLRTTATLATGVIAAALVSAATHADTATSPGTTPSTERSGSPVGEPIDPQNWVNPDDMTWDDFRPVPGTDWSDPSLEPTKKQFKAAIVLVDYPNQPFAVTQPPESTPFGMPTEEAHDIAREDVPEFYRKLLNVPGELNRGHTINEYWMEDSAGKFGIDVTAFGPYRLPGEEYEYHLEGFGDDCPKTANCDRNFRQDALAKWEADAGEGVMDRFDNVFYIGAGEDESAVWQEFGEMRFQTKEDVPDEFGPPEELKEADPTLTNWSKTRYVPWTSWKAAAAMWPNASGKTSIEAESSGRAVYAHEFSHNLGIGDNYNNPYGDPMRRTYSGIWDMLSRGTFNGPQGPHQRWHIPSTIGAQMGAHHMLRNKLDLGIVAPDSVVELSREKLADKGVLTTEITAREVQGKGLVSGLNLELTGGDRSSCEDEGHTGDKAYLCDGGGYDNYTVEVVDRMGSDSFTPDSGVLLAKTKNKDDAPFIWVKDANPQDIEMVDFTRPDGTEAM